VTSTVPFFLTVCRAGLYLVHQELIGSLIIVIHYWCDLMWSRPHSSKHIIREENCQFCFHGNFNFINKQNMIWCLWNALWNVPVVLCSPEFSSGLAMPCSEQEGVRNRNAMTLWQIQPWDISENRRNDSYPGYQLLWHIACLWRSLYTFAGLRWLRPFITTVSESQGWCASRKWDFLITPAISLIERG